MAAFDSISPKVAVPIVVLLGGLLLYNRKASASTPSKPNDLACPPFGIIPKERVLETGDRLIDQGVTALDLLTSKVLTEIYPRTPNGTVITWPSAAPFDVTRLAPSYRCLWDKVKMLLGSLEMPADDPTDPKLPAKILNTLLSSDPTPGKFFKIKKDWIMAGELTRSVAYRALQKVNAAAAKNDQLRLRYIRCITRGPGWNNLLYGSTLVTDKYTSLYADAGETLAAAFLPRNQDAIEAVVNGMFPQRTIGEGGEPIGGGNTYGLLWLPPVDAQLLAQGSLSCGNDVWEDGSPTIDPPPALLNLISGAPDLPNVND